MCSDVSFADHGYRLKAQIGDDSTRNRIIFPTLDLDHHPTLRKGLQHNPDQQPVEIVCLRVLPATKQPIHPRASPRVSRVDQRNVALRRSHIRIHHTLHCHLH